VLAGLQLPETLNKDLPQTLDDVSGRVDIASSQLPYEVCIH
jgi:hypothetical protein